ncbi:aldo/keto reductase [Micromonospora polyrhachis]|uniref:Aryl-alcohol dehydrogenase-like predicted oxidoreductase n=2 Tax=Micromonospora polyrhachis TaxID=1282883 RepID=A0A7W7SX85_9ACTN|nr:aryl-alcohol dehydrogenase-like predicted oxidoreductase [Micromonospora polyrhachis]
MSEGARPHMTTNTFRIGGDLEVRRLGFGAMHLPTDPGPARENSLAVTRRAVELGITLIDTAHLYGGGANEELLAEALYPYPEGLLVTTKVGVARSGPDGEWRLDGRPEVLRAQVEQALRRLHVERIELLQLHRIDPETPLADQLGTLRDLQTEGKIGRVGLSEVTVAELDQAREIVDVASVQNRYNVFDREHEPVLAACEAAGIAFLPWRPVAAGTSGTRAEIAAVATELGATATQVALAWLLWRSPVVLPIPGTARIEHLEENVAAADLHLTPTHRERLDRLAELA